MPAIAVVGKSANSCLQRFEFVSALKPKASNGHLPDTPAPPSIVIIVDFYCVRKCIRHGTRHTLCRAFVYAELFGDVVECDAGVS